MKEKKSVTPSRKMKLSPEVRAKMVEAAKNRWQKKLAEMPVRPSRSENEMVEAIITFMVDRKHPETAEWIRNRLERFHGQDIAEIYALSGQAFLLKHGKMIPPDIAELDSGTKNKIWQWLQVSAWNRLTMLAKIPEGSPLISGLLVSIEMEAPAMDEEEPPAPRIDFDAGRN